MPTDYVVFIHGVNTRSKDSYRRQARKIFASIKTHVVPNKSRDLKPIMLFWGDIASDSTEAVTKQLSKNSPAWKNIWFQDLRLNQVLLFVGDAALYLSRTVSIRILKQITAQSIEQSGLGPEQVRGKLPMEQDDGDRLHVVAHSWGTAILFDILFAKRWEEPGLSDEIVTSVATLRSYFFGVADSSNK
jgi:hypothetical protein